MKKVVIALFLLVAVSVEAQRVLTVEKEQLAPIVTGEHKNKLVSPNADPTESRIRFAYFGLISDKNEEYKDLANKIIFEYVQKVAIDTAYIPISEHLNLQFFKDALNNFFESYNYVRFRLNVDDLPPYWLEMNIQIDTATYKNYTQISLETGIFTGGAHPYLMNDYVLIHNKTAQVVTWDNLLTDKNQFTTVAEKYFRKTEKMKKGQDYSTYFFESQKFELSKNFVLTKKGITLIYLPYEAREWARGTILVKIPKGKIKKYTHLN